ncbi:MAG: hypothetical protein EXS58_03580 [Candidatus Latescibacteria bacterium]|nr:hypothetical protein [Candidatus Latescibacterota bacterium]
MMLNRSAKRSLLLALLVTLLAGALLGVSCHLSWADHSHEPSSCAVCTWFHFKGWVTAALVLLVCFVLQRIFSVLVLGTSSCCLPLHSARAPPCR